MTAAKYELVIGHMLKLEDHKRHRRLINGI